MGNSEAQVGDGSPHEPWDEGSEDTRGHGSVESAGLNSALSAASTASRDLPAGISGCPRPAGRQPAINPSNFTVIES